MKNIETFQIRYVLGLRGYRSSIYAVLGNGLILPLHSNFLKLGLF